ncbi:MAG: hypothetical protein WDM85_12075 [Caulobacteraceae bacterium]
MLLSALIGNNNSSASPRWAFVAPQEIERIDVLYGPFAAAYPGNSIGAVVNIATRMPSHLEAGVDVVGAWQDFSEYATRQNLGQRRGQRLRRGQDRAGVVLALGQPHRQHRPAAGVRDASAAVRGQHCGDPSQRGRSRHSTVWAPRSKFWAPVRSSIRRRTT